MPDLLMNPWFYAAAVPATILIGLSKGGLGGAMGQVGVPLMALVMPPVQAAAIMLPILIIMDVASLWSWRGYRDMPKLKLMLPGGLLGVGIGWLTASIVTDDMVKLIVGVIAIIFFARYVFVSAAKRAIAQPHNAGAATFWSTIAGFTSFVAHAGGPPYQVYTLPLRQDPKYLQRNQRDFLCHHQCSEGHPIFCARSIRYGKSAGIGCPGAACPTRHFCWCLDRKTHAR